MKRRKRITINKTIIKGRKRITVKKRITIKRKMTIKRRITKYIYYSRSKSLVSY